MSCVSQEPPEDEANIVEKILSARRATKQLKDEGAVNAHTQEQVRMSWLSSLHIQYEFPVTPFLMMLFMSEPSHSVCRSSGVAGEPPGRDGGVLCQVQKFVSLCDLFGR